MLVPYISAKSIATMLLFLMMGLAEKPLSIPTLLQLNNDSYDLYVPDTDKHFFFSSAQIQSILSSLPSDLRLSMVVGDMDLSKLAAYIVDNGLVTLGSHQPPHEYDNRSSTSSSSARNTLRVGISVRPNTSHAQKKMQTTYAYTFDPEKIKHLRKEGNVHALQSEQRNIERALRMRSIDAKTHALLTEWLNYVDRALIDWGSLPSALQAYRSLQKQGKKEELKAQLERINARLASWFWWLYDERTLKLEKHYLEKILHDPITQLLFAIAYGEGPESSSGFKNINNQWADLTPDERILIEKQIGFHPIRMAESLAASRSHRQLILQPNQPIHYQTEVTPSSVTTSTLPPTDTHTSSLMADTTISNAPQSDFVETYAYNSGINISKEVDQRIEQALQKIQPQDFDNFELYMAQINQVLVELRQTGQLTPTQERHLLARFIKRLFTSLNPVTQIKELPSALFHTLLVLLEVSSINTQDDDWLSPFNEKERIAQIHRFVEKFDLSQLSDEQWVDVAADALAGILTAEGVSIVFKALRTAKVFETIKSSTQPAQSLTKRLAEKLRTIAKPIEGTIATTAEGIPVEVGATTAAQETMFMQEANQVTGGAAKGTEGLLVSVAEQAIIQDLANTVAQNVQQNLPHLRQLFDAKTPGGVAELKNKFLKFEYEHILGMDLTWSRRGMPQIGGFHHDFMGVVEKSNVFEFANKVVHTNGLYSAELRYMGNKVKDIAFFPSHWTQEQVMSKIIEAYENYVKSGAKLELGTDLKYRIKGVTNEGVTIQMHITQKGKVTTAYPKI